MEGGIHWVLFKTPPRGRGIFVTLVTEGWLSGFGVGEPSPAVAAVLQLRHPSPGVCPCSPNWADGGRLRGRNPTRGKRHRRLL